MKCLFTSSCKEPKGLCCNFCSDKQCDQRCKDEHTECRLFDPDTNFKIPEDCEHHIIWAKGVSPTIIKTEKTQKQKVEKTSAIESNISQKMIVNNKFHLINNKQKMRLYKCENKFITVKCDKMPPEGFVEYITTKTRAENKAENLNSKLSRRFWSVEEVTNEV